MSITVTKAPKAIQCQSSTCKVDLFASDPMGKLQDDDAAGNMFPNYADAANHSVARAIINWQDEGMSARSESNLESKFVRSAPVCTSFGDLKKQEGTERTEANGHKDKEWELFRIESRNDVLSIEHRIPLEDSFQKA